MNRIFLLLTFVLFSTFIFAQQVVTNPATFNTAGQGDLYVDNDGVYYIGLQNGTLKEIGILTAKGTKSGDVLFWDNTDKKWFSKPAVVINTKTANYTLTSADNNKIIEFNSATNVVCTIPAGLSSGFQVSITQLGTGRVQFVGGATIRNAYNFFKTARRYSKAGIEIASNGEAIISGDVAK